jgi:hypothetical protein
VKAWQELGQKQRPALVVFDSGDDTVRIHKLSTLEKNGECMDAGASGAPGGLAIPPVRHYQRSIRL